jgi:hypothetical protein
LLFHYFTLSCCLTIQRYDNFCIAQYFLWIIFTSSVIFP